MEILTYEDDPRALRHPVCGTRGEIEYNAFVKRLYNDKSFHTAGERQAVRTSGRRYARENRVASGISMPALGDPLMGVSVWRHFSRDRLDRPRAHILVHVTISLDSPPARHAVCCVFLADFCRPPDVPVPRAHVSRSRRSVSSFTFYPSGDGDINRQNFNPLTL